MMVIPQRHHGAFSEFRITSLIWTKKKTSMMQLSFLKEEVFFSYLFHALYLASLIFF
jgi:hypothetical protein